MSALGFTKTVRSSDVERSGPLIIRVTGTTTEGIIQGSQNWYLSPYSPTDRHQALNIREVEYSPATLRPHVAWRELAFRGVSR